MWKSGVLRLGLVVATLLVFWKIKLPALLLGQIELWDFDIYYRIIQDVLAGKSPYSLSYMQTAGPPAVLVFFLPFVMFPLSFARGVMIGLSVLAAFGSCYHLTKKLFARHHLTFALGLHLLFWLSFLPRYNLNVGQPNLILMYVITLLLITENQKLKAVLLAAVVLIKTLYAGAFLSLLQSQKRVLVHTGLVLFCVAVVTLPILKPSFYQEYIQNRVPSYFFSTPVITDTDYYNQSLRSSTARLGLSRSYVVILVFTLLAGGFMVVKRGKLSAGFLFSLLVSPVVWQHYLVVVYPIAFLMGRKLWQEKRWSWIYAVGVVLLLTHMPWLHNQSVSFLNGVLASHFYISMVLLFVVSVQKDEYEPGISSSAASVLPAGRKVKNHAKA